MSTSQARENYSVDRGLAPLFADEITKLKLQANIILGDFIFNTVDEYGVAWVITDIEGWWRHPSAEMPDIPRGFGDGSYDVQGRYQARSLNLTGVFLTPEPSLVEAARDRLIAATNLVYQGAWLKTGSDPIRASWVRLSGDVEINTVNARGRTEFSIGLRAADPIKYSWNDQDPDGYNTVEIPAKNSNNPSSGSGSVVNIGNYGVPCFLEITGPFTSPGSIYNRTTNQLILLTQSLKGSVVNVVVNKQLTFDVNTLKDVATLTTQTNHQFKVGDNIFVNGVGADFDGEHIIVSTPTDTTFTYYADAATILDVSHKSLASGVATIETVLPHGFSVGNQITVNGVDSVFDGIYTIASVPANNRFTYAKTRVPPRTVTSKILVSNIATLTTSDAHNFIVGEAISVAGVDVNFNDPAAIVTAIPSPTEFSYAKTRTNARSVVNKSMTADVVTLTTSSAHGFIPNESVNITNIDISLNGGYTILAAPTPTTFTYKRPRATVRDISIKALTANVATLTTSTPHGFEVGEKVVIENVDSTFNGTYTITSLPSNTTFSYAKTAADLISTAVLNATVRAGSRKIKSRQLVGNTVTINTNSTHGVILGEQVTISGIDATFDGTYTVTTVPSATSFTYSKTGTNVTLADVSNAFVDMPGTITSTGVVPDGLATVAGSLPFTAATGTATASDTVARINSSGKAIKKNDVTFTPGISGATAVLPADILEIDTKNREVAFNGEVEGARGRVDVLADFIELAPGSNTIEFADTGAPESTATLRVYYRSGWLG
jgi:hypothetical protein